MDGTALTGTVGANLANPPLASLAFIPLMACRSSFIWSQETGNWITVNTMDKCLHACGSSRENLQVFSDSFHQDGLVSLGDVD